MNDIVRPEKGTGRPNAYRTEAGKRVPGVTTVLGRFKDSGALIRWAERMGRESLEPELVRLRAALRTIAEGQVPDGIEHRFARDVLAAPSAEGPSATEAKEKAAEIGSAVHDMVEAHLHGTDPRTALFARTPHTHAGPDFDFVRAAETAFEGFLGWLEATRLVVVATEIPLVSEVHLFGGTLDAVLRTPKGGLVLGDWKTSRNLYPEYCCQLGAYSILWRERRGEPIEGGAHVIRFGKNGSLDHRYWPDLSAAEEQFLTLRKAYEGDKAVEKLFRG